MKTLFNKIVKSLDLTDEGFSFRKILSLVVMVLIVYLHFEYINSTNVLTAILYDFAFICVLLGLLNLDKFIDAKYGGLNSGSQLPFPNTEVPPNPQVPPAEPPVDPNKPL